MESMTLRLEFLDDSSRLLKEYILSIQSLYMEGISNIQSQILNLLDLQFNTSDTSASFKNCQVLDIETDSSGNLIVSLQERISGVFQELAPILNPYSRNYFNTFDSYNEMELSSTSDNSDFEESAVPDNDFAVPGNEYDFY